MAIYTVSVADTLGLADTAAARNTAIAAAAVSTLDLDDAATYSALRIYQVDAASALALADSAASIGITTHTVAAADTLSLAATAASLGPHSPAVAATSTLALADVAAPARNTGHAVSATSALALDDDATFQAARILPVAAVSTLALADASQRHGDLLVGATSTLALADASTLGVSHTVSATSALVLADAATRGRELAVSATTGLALGVPSSTAVNPARAIAATDTFTLATSSVSTIGNPEGLAALALADLAEARVTLPSGDGVSGGDAGVGPRMVLAAGLSGDFPCAFAEAPSGVVLMANGVDPMHRWDPLTGVAEPAGVQPPASSLALAGRNIGTIVGTRYAFVRFLDSRGNPSNLSPISNVVNMGRDAPIDDIAVDPKSGAVTVTSLAHGLTMGPGNSGEVVIFQGINGLPIAGPLAVTILDEDRFTLPIAATGRWTGGGSWTWGVAEVVYGDVPLPVESKVARRQILRNLDGSLDTLYVDVDTDDLTSTLFFSGRSDEELATCEAVPLVGEDGLPFANRHGVPPSHKRSLVAHLGRTFAAGEVTVTEGCVRPVFGLPTIAGVATSWTSALVGRFLYVDGAARGYGIEAVDESAQVLTLAGGYRDPTIPYALYVIRPGPAERKLVYYSEPGLPEAWPPWNAVEFPDDNDEIVGLMVLRSFLYVLERRHIYRYAMQHDPATDGFQFLQAERGVVNPRCWVVADGTAYLLDELGIYTFDGSAALPISAPIQNLFQGDPGPDGLQVDWSADPALWHAAHDPPWHTIRWFLTMIGTSGPEHAICFDYRRRCWWIEHYPEAITAATVGTIGGVRCSLAGTTARRILRLGGTGTLDGVDPAAGTVRGQVTAASDTTLTDATASFAANLSGAPVTIAQGTGRGQRRTIATNTLDTLEVVQPWDVLPDTTSIYQVGGIPWIWRTGWHEFASDESDNARDLRLTFRPLADPATLSAQLYYDHADDPRPWAFSQQQDSITTTAGDPNLDIDLRSLPTRQGQVTVRLTGHADSNAYGDTYTSLCLSGVQAAEQVRLYRVSLLGVLPPEGTP